MNTRFRPSKRPVHLNVGWRYLVFDNETVGFAEDVDGIDPNGYPTAEMAQAAIDALPVETADPLVTMSVLGSPWEWKGGDRQR